MPNIKSGFLNSSEIKRENFRDDGEYVIALFEYAIELQDKMDAGKISYPYEFDVQATKRQKIKREHFRSLDDYCSAVAPPLKKEVEILEKAVYPMQVYKKNIVKKLPPINCVASYNELIELAFNADTKDSEAAKAKDALTRAQKKRRGY